MASHPKLVNKQFNSPIGLYSEQNIRDVIARESQILANGAVGINFHNPAAGKPTNLQNSAVLRMLEEEEHRKQNGFSASNGYDSRSIRNQIKWPPPEYERKNLHRSTFKDVVTSGGKRVTWPPPLDENDFAEQAAQAQAQGGPQYTSQSPTTLQNNYASAQQQTSNDPSHRYPLKPLDISSASSLSNNRPSSVSPVTNQNPAAFRPPTPNRPWAPVHSPVRASPQPQYKPAYQQPQHYQIPPQQYQPHVQQYQPAPQQYQSSPQQYQPAPQQYQPPHQQYQPSQQYQQPQQQYNPSPTFNQPTSQLPTRSQAAQNQVAPQYNAPATRPVEPPPTIITLRKQAPVSQASPPVVTSQPATATLRGGKHLRGDLKWPPEIVRSQMEEENRARLELARGPACRPLAVRKDYGPFFAQNALNSTYPSYKVPPGTQFYDNKAW